MFRGRGATIGYFFVFIWLVFLLIPAVDFVTGRYSGAYRVGGLAALIGFVACYDWFWLRGCRTGALGPRVLGLATIAVLALLLTLVQPNDWEVFIYVAVAAGFAFDWRRALWAVGAVGALAGVTIAVNLIPVWQALPVAAEVLLIGLGMIGIARLMASNQELREAREEIARLAVSEERLRFARDLHDLLGHSLSVVVLKAELAGKLAEVQPQRAAAEMVDVERVARQALREVREAVAGYRQPSLGQELNSAREVLTAAGIDCRLRNQAGPLPPAVESALGWAVREAVTNVVRHSHARSCSITLARDDGKASLEVADDGRGAPDLTYGSGLRGLEERVSARGGSVATGTEGGFTLRVALPLQEVSTAPPAAVAAPS